jgi:two-component system, NtrC family, response regulator AtoC
MPRVGPRILIVDDDVLLAQAIARLLKRAGYVVATARDGIEAIKKLDTEFFDLLVTDLHLPGVDGWEVMKRASALVDPPVIIVVSGRSDIRGAVEAMRRGASDFIEKPLDIADLEVRLAKALETATIRRRLRALEAQTTKKLPVAVSNTMKRVFELADRVAATPSSSALILGESGVGKEVIATRIHERSNRRSGPFVRVNLAAMPDAMVEAELFGSVRGAFTDSKRDRAGMFASADGGTLLLDEILEFRIELQAKLLRVLEERSFFPVGSDRERHVNVRVIAATNRDPADAIAKGTLRDDLYYRIGAVIIHIPPLRERREDILPLAEGFLRYLAADSGRTPLELGEDARAALVDYAWPGNVRELRNVIERAVMMSDSSLVAAEALGLRGAALPQSQAKVRVARTLKLDDARQVAVDTVEKEHIEHVLQLAAGSRTRAAEILGVSRSTLWEKLKRYGI